MNTFRLLHDIVTYSAGSLIIGVLLTIVLEILLFVTIKGFFPKSVFSPFSLIVGIILALFLGFRMVPLCGAVSLKWMCIDFENYIVSLIPQDILSSELIVDQEYTDQLIDRALDEFPIFASFVESGTFIGQSAAEIAHIMADTLNSFLNQFIIEAVLWSLFYLFIASALVVWTMKKNWDYKLGSSRTRPNSFSTGNNMRQRHVSYGHSRSSRLRR